MKRRRQPSSTVGAARLRTRDAIGTSTLGLRNRRSRTLLTAMGIAIGIASLVAVVGISSSSRADLIDQLDQLGTNLVVVQPGQSLAGSDAKIATAAPAMVRRIGPVLDATGITKIDTDVQRNQWVDSGNGLSVIATEVSLLDTIEGTVNSGRFLDASTAELPVVVLGSVAAERLAISSLEGAPTVDIAGHRFAVIGILDRLPLHPDLDRAAFIGQPAAISVLDVKVNPTSVYARIEPTQVQSVVKVLPRTVSPTAPNEASVSYPSDTLQARAQVDANLRNLLLGLGAVALLVGGIGIANVMVISVLERRGEIGLRRALGAARRHILVQFVVESMTLSLLGGLIGVAAGTAATVIYARRQQWLVSVPTNVLVAGVGATLVLGAIAGLYPAVRAARLDPAEAVRPH